MTKLKSIDAKLVVRYAAVKRTELEDKLIGRINKIITVSISDNAEQGIIDFIVKDKMWETEIDKKLNSPLSNRVVNAIKLLFKSKGYKITYKESTVYNAQYDTHFSDGYYIRVRPKWTFRKKVR